MAGTAPQQSATADSLLAALHECVNRSQGPASHRGPDLSAVTSNLVRWLLHEARTRSERCARLLLTLSQQQEDAEEERRRKQRRRQAKEAAMKRMARQRAAFASAFAAELAGDEADSSPPASPLHSVHGSPHAPPPPVDGFRSRETQPTEQNEATNERCIMCHCGVGRAPHTNTALDTMMALCLVRPSPLRTAGVDYGSRGAGGRVNFHMQLCGHAMHLTCWRRYVTCAA